MLALESIVRVENKLMQYWCAFFIPKGYQWVILGNQWIFKIC